MHTATIVYQLGHITRLTASHSNSDGLNILMNCV